MKIANTGINTLKKAKSLTLPSVNHLEIITSMTISQGTAAKTSET